MVCYNCQTTIDKYTGQMQNDKMLLSRWDMDRVCMRLKIIGYKSHLYLPPSCHCMCHFISIHIMGFLGIFAKSQNWKKKISTKCVARIKIAHIKQRTIRTKWMSTANRMPIQRYSHKTKHTVANNASPEKRVRQTKLCARYITDLVRNVIS